jgi:hypothetical protein
MLLERFSDSAIQQQAKPSRKLLQSASDCVALSGGGKNVSCRTAVTNQVNLYTSGFEWRSQLIIGLSGR